MPPAFTLRLLGHYCKLNGVFGAERPGQLALASFLKVPKPNVTPKQTAFLQTARRSTLPFAGETIALFEWGPERAPYVYTAYGYGYNAGRWRHFAPALVDAGYRVVAFDYVGHGYSTGRELDFPTLLGLHAAVLRHFGRPALALAHSFGAGTLAYTLSELGRDYWPERFAAMASFSDATYIFRQFAEALGFSESQYASLDRAVIRRTGKPIDGWDPASRVHLLRGLPALIAHDPEDQVTAYSNAERLHAHWPGSYLFAAPGAGHGFTERSVTRDILNWLMQGVLPKGAQPFSDDLVRLDAKTAHGDSRSAYFRKKVGALG